MNAKGNIPGQISELMQQDKITQRELKRVKKELQRKDSSLAETDALLVLRKKRKRFGGPWTTRIQTSTSDLECIIQLIEEAVATGVRQSMACDELGISTRTFQRWINPNEPNKDQRPLDLRPEPKNKLSQEEKKAILKTVNQPGNANKSPSQIIPALVDEGIYTALESSFYRVMYEAEQVKHRGRSEKTTNRVLTSHVATAPNQVWSWDITYLSGPIKGLYYYLYLIPISSVVILWAGRYGKMSQLNIQATLSKKPFSLRGSAGTMNRSSCTLTTEVR